MHRPINLSTATLSMRGLTSRTPLRGGVLLVALGLALAWLTLPQTSQAVTPAPDGGYPNNNTAEGDGALFSLTSGDNNTANGDGALYSNTTGGSNTASGLAALFYNTTGSYNTANGSQALENNNTGSNNTANGHAALFNSSTGANNTANGAYALIGNSTGNNNTATGFSALYNNNGIGNTAQGSQALFSNTIGANNTAVGINALYSNTGGNFNTATGTQALQSAKSNFNAAFGFWALLNDTTGANNVALGYQAGANLTTGGNNIDIGANVTGNAGDAGKIRIGKQGTQNATFIAGISGKTVASGVGVIINSSGQLGTVQSSARFKTAIKPMDQSSEALLKLKPVTFRYKEELDPEKVPQFGLIAEEVEKVNPDLVVRDDEGKITTVRYDAVNAMLLNEFLKEHRKVEDQEHKAQEQEVRLTKQDAIIAQQQKQIEALTATVQKVSDQVELNRRAPQLVADDQ